MKPNREYENKFSYKRSLVNNRMNVFALGDIYSCLVQNHCSKEFNDN